MDKIFKEIADGYTERQGGELLREDILLRETGRVPDFDIPMIRKRRSARRFAFFGAAAAALIFAVFAVRQFAVTVPRGGDGAGAVAVAEGTPADGNAAEAAAPAEPAVGAAEIPEGNASDAAAAADAPVSPVEIVQLSARLPVGSQLLNTKFDIGETIYMIQNPYGNTIILSVRRSGEDVVPETETFTAVDVNGKNGYLLVKRDYKMLTVQTDGLLYRFSSEYEAGDLYELAAALI